MFYLTYGTNKVLRIMEIHVTPPHTEPEASFIILDGSALINLNLNKYDAVASLV